MSTARSHTPFRRSNSSEIEPVSANPTDLGKSFFKDAADQIGKFGGDFMGQLFGMNNEKQYNPEAPQNEPKIEGFRAIGKERITVFSLREQRESKEIQQIKELLKQIKEEIKAIKAADNSLAEEIKAAEKLTIEVDPEGGVYHIRFLEVILKLLHTARKKIGESSAWLDVMHSKKKKRGSAFASLSKKQGTQYSMSQELSNARSTQ